MNDLEARSAYDRKSSGVSEFVRSLGVDIRKSTAVHEVQVGNATQTVAFPIVSDERYWREISAAEAFYSAMIDAKRWLDVRLENAEVGPDEVEGAEVALLRAESSEQAGRMRRLAVVLGGEAYLSDLFTRVEDAA